MLQAATILVAIENVATKIAVKVDDLVTYVQRSRP